MSVILNWYAALLLCGASVMPFAAFIFKKYEDRGWLFAKTLGLLIGSWVIWTLNVLEVRYFTQGNIVAVILTLAAVNYGICTYSRIRRKNRNGRESGNNGTGTGGKAEFLRDKARQGGTDRGVLRGFSVKTVLFEEAALCALFALWVYIIGFKPEAYGTEKFMDYGFLTSMMRSLTMPFEDTWFSGNAVNYYYGGQYITAYLIKLTGVTAGEGYNLMRATVAAFSFALPFALVKQMLSDRLNKTEDAEKSRGRTARISASETGDQTAETKNRTETGYLKEGKNRSLHCIAPWLGGLLAGLAAAFCGNMHYVIYGIIKPIVCRIQGVEYSYWFPDSTRYIGYDPDLPDKTIHEFPAYSTVLGDLHAHYINILFVVTVCAIAYAWAQNYVARKNGEERVADGQRVKDGRQNNKLRDIGKNVLRVALAPEVLLIGFMTGVFRWTNFWDFPIYYVVAGSIFFFVQLRDVPRRGSAAESYGDSEKDSESDSAGDRAELELADHTLENRILKQQRRTFLLQFILNMLAIAAVMFGVGYLAALPFTASFDQISSEIGVTHSHTLWYQLVILWGLPAACLVGYVIVLIRENRKPKFKSFAGNRDFYEAQDADPAGGSKKSLTNVSVRKRFFATREGDSEPLPKCRMPLPDLCMLMFGLCAAGLVFLPEVIYVKDIYAAEHYRANTMFKLTYQAFILFGMMMGYVLTRAIALGKGRILRACAVIGTVLLLLTGGYIVQSCISWFGNIFIPENRVSTDASVFVSEYFPSDFEAVNFLNTEVSGQPVVLEAPGDSYSDYERISVSTGLPTIAGWHTHEWLWRGDTAELDQRIADAETIYTSGDAAVVRGLAEEYNISYIYVGNLEREKYQALNDAVLLSLGETVYDDGAGTYIVLLDASVSG